MQIFDQMRKLWKAHSLESRTSKWAERVIANLSKVKNARAKMHSWGPLKIYVSTTEAMKAGLKSTFSLRFWGQEIGKLVVDKHGNVNVIIEKKHVTTNKRDFSFNLASASYDWNSVEAKKLRQHFIKYDSKHRTTRAKKGKSIEHFVETHLIHEMKKATRTKLNGKLGGIQPVLLNGNLPFQVPVPFKASTGKPQVSNRGNIDILARRDGRMLSVWELKAPGQIKDAVAQAYIYGIALAMMLRSNRGVYWANIFGMKRPPKQLKIELVVAITGDKELEFYRQAADLLKDNRLELPLYATSLQLAVAFYEERTYALNEFRVL